MENLGRREFLQGTAAAAFVAAAKQEDDPSFKIKNGRVKQTIMGWTYNPMPTEELAKHCKALGMVALEGVDSMD